MLSGKFPPPLEETGVSTREPDYTKIENRELFPSPYEVARVSYRPTFVTIDYPYTSFPSYVSVRVTMMSPN